MMSKEEREEKIGESSTPRRQKPEALSLYARLPVGGEGS